MSLLTALLVVQVMANVMQVEATLYFRDVKITLNGNAVTPTNANGDVVEPFIYNDVTYLPVASISRLLGLDVGWDNDTSTVILTGYATAAMPAPPFTLAAGQYIVGEDIPAGKYDCRAVSGSGNFQGDVKSLPWGSLNEILGAPGTVFEDRETYSNLRLENGDVIIIRSDLKVEFTAN